jgi:hypothetical protein
MIEPKIIFTVEDFLKGGIAIHCPSPFQFDKLLDYMYIKDNRTALKTKLWFAHWFSTAIGFNVEDLEFKVLRKSMFPEDTRIFKFKELFLND